MPSMILARPDLFSRAVLVSCVAPDPGLTTIEMTGTKIHGGSHPFNDTALSVRDRYRAMFCNDMGHAQAEAFLDKLGPDQWPRSCYSQSEWRHDHLRDLPVSYVLCLQDAILPNRRLRPVSVEPRAHSPAEATTARARSEDAAP